MELDCAVDILTKLAGGINPITGHALSKDDSCNQVEIVRALYKVLENLSQNKYSCNKYSDDLEIENQIVLDISFFSCKDRPELSSKLNNEITGLIDKDESGYVINKIDLIEFINKYEFSKDILEKLELHLNNKCIRIYCEMNDWIIGEIDKILKPDLSGSFLYRISKTEFNNFIKKYLLENVIHIINKYINDSDILIYDDLDNNIYEKILNVSNNQNNAIYDEDINELSYKFELDNEDKNKIYYFLEDNNIKYNGSKAMKKVYSLVMENDTGKEVCDEKLDEIINELRDNNLNDNIIDEIYEYIAVNNIYIKSKKEYDIENKFKDFIDKKTRYGRIKRDDIDNYIYDNNLNEKAEFMIKTYLENKNIKVVEFYDV